MRPYPRRVEGGWIRACIGRGISWRWRLCFADYLFPPLRHPRGACVGIRCIVGVSPSWSAFAKSAGTMVARTVARIVPRASRCRSPCFCGPPDRPCSLPDRVSACHQLRPGPVHLPETANASHPACTLHDLYISGHPSISVHPVLALNAVLCIHSHQKRGGSGAGTIGTSPLPPCAFPP